MAYVVTQACCADASCVVACPVNCIHPAPGEPGFAEAEMVFVDARTCVGCGACASACPVDAVKPASRLTPAERPFAALAAEYYECFPHSARTPLAVVERQRRLSRSGPFRVAVVGAGPAGLYTADGLLAHPEISVDVYDRLPTPHGLVRAGVAPDHPHTRHVEGLFTHIEDQPRFRYFLGVEIGRDVTLVELSAQYDAVVWAGGAAHDKPLGIPGEDLPGSLSATALVGWYNGHPDHQDLAVDLGHERAVVVGNGNVALDLARVLTADPEALARTDVAPGALAALARSRVREVVVLGRRGPAQAAFTVPELVGLAGLADAGRIDVVVQGPAGLLETDEPDARARLLLELSRRPRTPGRRAVVLRFLAGPRRVLGDEGRGVTGLEVDRTRLETGPGGVPVAVPTGGTEVIEAGLVLRSVGYRGHPVPGLPHDPVAGTVVHDRGRVRPGVYVAGWAKRGPTGFIGTNKADAAETVERVLDDLDARATPAPVGTLASIAAVVAGRVPDAVDLSGWRAIDAEERRRGAVDGRPRTKIVEVAEMLRVARAGAARHSARRRGYAALTGLARRTERGPAKRG